MMPVRWRSFTKSNRLANQKMSLQHQCEQQFELKALIILIKDFLIIYQAAHKLPYHNLIIMVTYYTLTNSKYNCPGLQN